MSSFQPFSETFAGLQYTLTFIHGPLDTLAVCLTLPGTAPFPLTLLRGEDARPSDASGPWPAGLPQVTPQARKDVARAAELLADGEGGWALPLLPGPALDDLETWALQTLDRRRVPFQTGWMACACGHIRQRLRRDAGGYHLHAQAMALDWEDLAQTVLRAAVHDTQALALARLGDVDDMMLGALAQELARVTQADPEVATLALEASTFERTVPTLEQALAAMQTEATELHEQVDEQWQQVGILMTRYVPQVLEGTVFENVTPLDSPMDLLDLDDEDEDEDDSVALALFEDARRRAPKVLSFDTPEAAYAFLQPYRVGPAPLPFLRADPVAPDASWRTLGSGGPSRYVRDLVQLLTGDQVTGALCEWMLRVRPDWQPAQLLHWLWVEWEERLNVPYGLSDMFEHLQDIILIKSRAPFRDAESLHAYLLAQVEANGYRVIRADVQGEPLYTAVVPELEVPRTGRSRRAHA